MTQISECPWRPNIFDHVAISALENPLPILKQAREQCPVSFSERHGGFWTLFRYQDVVEAARDHKRLSSREPTIPWDLPFPTPPVASDPPLHMQYRAPLLDRFSPGVVATLEPALRSQARAMVNAFVERGSADLVAELNLPFPAYGAMEILQLPRQDYPMFQDWAIRLFRNQLQEDTSLAVEVLQYFGKMYEEFSQSTSRDIPAMARHLVIGDEEIQVVDYALYLFTLVAAGLDTTANGASNMLILLGQRPDLRGRLLAEPAIMPQAIEELLRYVTPLPGLSRIAKENMAIGGQRISEGEKVLLHWMAANHDPDAFPNPDEIDFDRESIRHVSFGIGPHRCLGMHLARLELRIMLEELLAAIPDYRVIEEGVVREGGVTRAVYALPIEFTPGQARS